jgi:hypothetical protein
VSATTEHEQYEYDEVDMDALRRCMAIGMAPTEPGRKGQLVDMLKDRPWIEVAEFAAYGCQRRALKLKPFDEPPCWGGEDPPGKAAALLDRMLAAGISQWEPDPMAALAQAKT